MHSHRHNTATAPWLRLDLGRGSAPRLPCPARCAGPTAWTPACRLRLDSRSGTAASPCRCAGTARIPGPSRQARALPHSRSRVHVRVRVRALTSWRWAQAVSPRYGCWVKRKTLRLDHDTKVKGKCALVRSLPRGVAVEAYASCLQFFKIRQR